MRAARRRCPGPRRASLRRRVSWPFELPRYAELRRTVHEAARRLCCLARLQRGNPVSMRRLGGALAAGAVSIAFAAGTADAGAATPPITDAFAAGAGVPCPAYGD